MVERAILSPSIVDSAQPPERGERWIADTKQKGLGLRLWRSKKGEPAKAYAVRASSSLGVSTRRSLNYWDAYWRWYDAQRLWLPSLDRPTLGQLVDTAREWARDQLDEIKGRRTLTDERAEQAAFSEVIARKLSSKTLEEFAELELRRMEGSGFTQAYVDRTRKLFFRHVGPSLRNQNIKSLRDKDVLELISSKFETPSAAHIIRPFFVRMLRCASRYDVPILSNVHEIGDYDLRKSLRAKRSAQREWLDDWNIAKLADFLTGIEKQEGYWQQKYAICVFFEMQMAPLSALLRARWAEIGAYSWVNSNREFLAWKHSNRWSGFERLSERTLGWLRKARIHSIAEFGETEYLWPSRFSRSEPHIRTVDHVWRRAISEAGIPYVSPIQFRKSVREKNWFVRHLLEKARDALEERS